MYKALHKKMYKALHKKKMKNKFKIKIYFACVLVFSPLFHVSFSDPSQFGVASLFHYVFTLTPPLFTAVDGSGNYSKIIIRLPSKQIQLICERRRRRRRRRQRQ